MVSFVCAKFFPFSLIISDWFENYICRFRFFHIFLFCFGSLLLYWSEVVGLDFILCFKPVISIAMILVRFEEIYRRLGLPNYALMYRRSVMKYSLLCVFCIVEEKDKRAKGGECDSWTRCSWWGTSFRCCPHFCFIQRHFHCEFLANLTFHFRLIYMIGKLTLYLHLQHVTDLSGRETLVRITGKQLLTGL